MQPFLFRHKGLSLAYLYAVPYDSSIFIICIVYLLNISLLGYKNDPYLDYDPTLKPDDMITQGINYYF